MDVQSPHHLERLRDQPEIKAALLRQYPSSDADDVRFERAAKNALYWPPIDAMAAFCLAVGKAANASVPQLIYGRQCLLITTTLGDNPGAPYTIAMVDAQGEPVEKLVALLQSVTHDYWFGSYFWK